LASVFTTQEEFIEVLCEGGEIMMQEKMIEVDPRDLRFMA
jgi:hypothetical protein